MAAWSPFAADFLGLSLPKAKQELPRWQAAAEAVMMAAEGTGPLLHAQSRDAPGDEPLPPLARYFAEEGQAI